MRIGVLVSRFPYPLEKGDKLRIYHQIKALAEKHEIYLCAISDRKITKSDFEELKKFCKAIKVVRINKVNILINLIRGLLFTKLPLQVAYFYKKSAQNEILTFFRKSEINHLFCQLIRVTEYVKNQKNIPKTLDYMDVLSKGMERRIEKANLFTKPFVKIETNRLKKYEHFIFNSFQHRCIISEQDRDLIIHAQNQKIKIIRNGVDQSFFEPRVILKKYDLVFTGNMSYAPNVDSAVYLVEEILPELKKIYPAIELAIVGATPSVRVQKLEHQGVTVTGWVDDIREYYAASKIFIAPMQIGTGLQNKLLEAMAMQIPCITSSLANNALKATDKKNVLIANSKLEYVTAIQYLLENENEANRIALSGLNFVNENYNWKATAEQLENLFLSQ